MQHKQLGTLRPARNGPRELVKPAGTHLLRELLKLYECEDVVTRVDKAAFGGK